ncbi:MAG: Rrf2 family transcriptional regulator [Phycisphaerae bacterium]|nr:Rrf2 family transcriptional regulator [Phycisphaerae bacterium]
MLSSTAEYALRAAVFLASSDGVPANSERIAEVTKVPSGYISKVMRDLVVAQLVSSQRGPNGGFALARPASEITILDVVNAVTPIQRIRSCPLGDPKHISLCPLHRRLDDAIAAIEQGFASTTLNELLTPIAGGGKQCTAITIGGNGKAAVVPTAARATKRAPRGR